MFCNQCEQTTRGDVCHQWGACGNSPEVDALQDLLVHCLRGLSQVALQAKSLGIATRDTDEFTCEMLFSTLTNVNFAADDFVAFINRAIALRDSLKLKIQAISNTVVNSAIANFQPASNPGDRSISQPSSDNIQPAVILHLEVEDTGISQSYAEQFQPSTLSI